MKTLVKLVILLAVLAICMPVEGEILIYKKTVKCWDAIEDEPWDVEEFTIRGYLVLDVNHVNGDVIVEASAQVEYWKDDDGNKWWDVNEENFYVIRVENDEVEWVLAEADTDPNQQGEITMLKGKARDMNVGFRNNNKREVPRRLSGELQRLWTDEGDWLSICEWELRLKTQWTKWTNENRDDINDAINNIIVWLEDRGYEEDA